MDIVKKYKVFCLSENQFFEVWKMTTPECCPNNSRHDIDETLTQQIDQKYFESDRIQHVNINSKNFRNTNGNYCGEGRSYIIPAGTSVFTQDIPINIPMCVFGMRLCVREEHYGDMVSFVGMPDTIVGVLTEPTDISTNIIHVSETVLQHVIPGYYISLNGEEQQVTHINKETGTLKTKEPFNTLYEIGTPVKLNVYIVRNYSLDAPGSLEVGYGAFGGKVIPQDATLRMIYYKADATRSKTFSFNVEFMY